MICRSALNTDTINVVLVNYPYVSSVVKYPIGLINLKNILDKSCNNIRTNIVDFNRLINDKSIAVESFKNKDYNLLSSYILSYSPHIIGFSTIAISLDIVLELSSFIKSQHPELIIFLGGPAASVSYARLLQDFTCIDYILLGESESCIESTIITASAGASFQDIRANIAFRDGEEICEKHDAPDVVLDKLPYLDLSGYSDLSEIDIEIGRGCPFNCYFCATSIFWHRKYEVKSVHRLIGEIEYYIMEYGIVNFNFIHDLLTYDRDFIIDFCKEILNKKIKINWACSARADYLDNEMIEYMYIAGCNHIFIGIESGSNRMQRIIQKNLNVETLYDIFTVLSQYQISLTVSFVYGFPEEEQSDLIDTLKLIQCLNDKFGCKVVLSRCTLYPNTTVYLQNAENVNTFLPSGDYLALHNAEPSELIVNNKELFPCFFCLDNQREYPHLDVFINFYIRLIKATLPNFYLCLSDKYSYYELYSIFYHLNERLDPYTRELYEKRSTKREYFIVLYDLLREEVEGNDHFDKRIREAFCFDMLLLSHSTAL